MPPNQAGLSTPATPQIPSTVPFDPKHYILGRIALPPSVAQKKSKPFVFTGSTGALATNATATVTIQIHDDAYFLVEEIQIISSILDNTQDKATVQITDNSQSQSWSNIALPIRDVGGSGHYPKYLSDPNILRPTSTISFQITNNNASTANYYILLVGRKIYGVTNDDITLLQRRMWYQYGLNVTSLGSSALQKAFTLQIYNESDFLLKKLLSQQLINQVFANSGGSLDQEVLIQLRNTVDDTYLFSDYVPARAVFGMHSGAQVSTANSWGTGEANCLRKPWLLRRNSILQATLTNDSTTNISSGFILVFEGIRIFDAR